MQKVIHEEDISDQLDELFEERKYQEQELLYHLSSLQYELETVNKRMKNINRHLFELGILNLPLEGAK